jgi:hypothetical protein
MRHIFFLLLIAPGVSFAQPLKQFNEEKSKIDQRLMIGLGSWATSNFIVSGIGWATTTKGEAHYFHQMNVLWNTVNLGLAIPGYLKAKKEVPPHTLAETMRLQRKTENIFLVNTGLDVLYVSSGFLLCNLAEKSAVKKDQYNGFGNGLIMQGGFLFLFDLTAYAIHKYHAKHSMPQASMSIRMSSNGTGVTWNIGTNQYTRNKLFL